MAWPSTERLFAPVDIASVVFFRITLGSILLWEVCRFFHYGWIESVYLVPTFHFTYFGFEWIRPWPGSGMYWHFFALGVLAACLLLGVRYRLAAALLCLGWTYVLLLEKAQYLNHLYLICLVCFLMAFVPAHRAFSVDAWRNAELRGGGIPAWSLWALRIQFAIPYFYGGLAKLNGDWLQGHPMQMWMSRMDHVRVYVPVFGEPWLALLVSYCGMLLDLTLVPLLLWRRTRKIAFCLAVVFHVFNAAMFRIGIFPWLMICATMLFLPPDWPRRLWRRAITALPSQLSTAVVTRSESRRVAFLGLFLLIQLLIPFRHWLYPGVVDWTDEGSRFAWRMMLCDKAGAFRIVLVDPNSGRTAPVDPREFLSPQQLDKLSRDPEMLREFAAFLKKDLGERGLPQIEVRAFALCSLNGRKPQLLVDPQIDLGAQPRSMAPSPWIVPLVEPLRDKPWLVPQSEWEMRVSTPQSSSKP